MVILGSIKRRYSRILLEIIGITLIIFITLLNKRVINLSMKMVDQYITMEGKFDIVLYGKQSYSPTTKKATKEFVTNFDGQFPAKSPFGMFPTNYIPNDLALVLEQVKKYYEGE